jgi:hypothetical protein
MPVRRDHPSRAYVVRFAPLEPLLPKLQNLVLFGCNFEDLPPEVRGEQVRWLSGACFPGWPLMHDANPGVSVLPPNPLARAASRRGPVRAAATPVCESRVDAPRVQDRRLLARATCPPDPKKPVGVFVSHEPQMTARIRLWHRHSVHGPCEAMPTASTWPESRTAGEPATNVGQTANRFKHICSPSCPPRIAPLPR